MKKKQKVEPKKAKKVVPKKPVEKKVEDPVTDLVADTVSVPETVAPELARVQSHQVVKS